MNDRTPRATTTDVYEMVVRLDERQTQFEKQLQDLLLHVNTNMRAIASEEAKRAGDDNALRFESGMARLEQSTSTAVATFTRFINEQSTLTRRLDALEESQLTLKQLQERSQTTNAAMQSSLDMLVNMHRTQAEQLREHGIDIDALQDAVNRLIGTVNNQIMVQRDYETRSGHLISLFTGFNPSQEGNTRRIPNTMQQVEDVVVEAKTQREAIALLTSTVKHLEDETRRKSPARAAAESAFPRPIRRFAWVIITNPNTYRVLAGLAATAGVTALSGLSQLLTQLLGN